MYFGVLVCVCFFGILLAGQLLGSLGSLRYSWWLLLDVPSEFLIRVSLIDYWLVVSWLGKLCFVSCSCVRVFFVGVRC